MAFLANYRCGNGLAGGQTLTLELLVSTPLGQGQSTTVSGVGRITQATNPPLNLVTFIKGVVHMLNGPTAVAMTGTSVSGEQNFQGVLLLPHGWGKPGSASFVYVRDGEQIDVGPVEAQPIAAEKAA